MTQKSKKKVCWNKDVKNVWKILPNFGSLWPKLLNSQKEPSDFDINCISKFLQPDQLVRLWAWRRHEKKRQLVVFPNIPPNISLLPNIPTRLPTRVPKHLSHSSCSLPTLPIDDCFPGVGTNIYCGFNFRVIQVVWDFTQRERKGVFHSTKWAMKEMKKERKTFFWRNQCS